MENHQNSPQPDLNSIVRTYHSTHKHNRPNCTIQTPSDYGLEKTKLTDTAQSEVDYDLTSNGQTAKVLIVDDDANDVGKDVASKQSATTVLPSNEKMVANAAKKDETVEATPTTSEVADAKTDNPEQKVIAMNHEDVNAKASTFIDHNNDNKNVSPAHKQNDSKAKGKNTPLFVPDANGIIHTTVQAVNDLSAESIYGHDRKIYITAKLAKRMGLGAPNVKALDVNGIMIPIERLTKQELRHIKHEEAEQTRKTKKEKRIARRNGDDDLI